MDGLYYTTTSGQSGFTSNGGQYTYVDGDTVTFYLGEDSGGILLGSATASGTVTPLTMAGVADSTDQRVVNMARLLQSLDDATDGNIAITANMRAQASILSRSGMTLDFNVSTSAFDNYTSSGITISSMIQTVSSADGGSARSLQSATAAQEHLQDTLGTRSVSTASLSGTFNGGGRLLLQRL
ncbi:hypothetical protein MAIT1_05281 [Magnetofaba australis IT-1]|uniref:Uncharacterized protein n=1 Tax=Magnetofaba australis IT-1 TaxID=1434232 RepID=A0A1Y2K4C4_9PROT|nr:hypothetical protein MAIT1_05281 [Magnetofaba australis IT-1]